MLSAQAMDNRFRILLAADTRSYLFSLEERRSCGESHLVGPVCGGLSGSVSTTGVTFGLVQKRTGRGRALRARRGRY